MAHTHSSFYVISLLLFSLHIVLSYVGDGGYSPKPYSDENPNLEKDNILSTTIAIQGIVYCKSGPKPITLEGIIITLTNAFYTFLLY